MGQMHPISEFRPGISIDHDRRIVVVEGREVALTRTQCRMIAALVARPFVILSRADLSGGTPANERAVPAHIKDLRRKLGSYADCVITVRKAGYCWRPPPMRREPETSATPGG